MFSVENLCPVYNHEIKIPKKFVKKPAGGLKKKKQLRAKILGNFAYVKICQISKESPGQPDSCTTGKNGQKANPRRVKYMWQSFHLCEGILTSLRKDWRYIIEDMINPIFHTQMKITLTNVSLQHAVSILYSLQYFEGKFPGKMPHDGYQ